MLGKSFEMARIKVHDKIFRTMIPYDKIMEAIDGVAEKVNQDYKDAKEPPMLLCVLNGALPFTAALLERLYFDCQLQSIKVSSYDGIHTTGHLTTKLGPTADVRGQSILICEDLVDTGITIRELKKLLLELGAKEVKICSMLLKRGKLRAQLIKEGLIPQDADENALQPYIPEYYGMDIANEFIVGFGLDYNELGRNYRDIYVIDE